MTKQFTPMFGTALRDKLTGIRPGIQKSHGKNNNEGRDPMPSPMSIGADGVDHINIWDESETDLGKILAHNTPIYFIHNVFGRFSCIESFWHYLCSEEHEDRIRTMTGKALKVFSKKLEFTRVVNFRAIIMDANWQKVKQHREIADAIKSTNIPFDCYYIYKRSDGIRIRPTFAHWTIRGFTEIRNALNENREPNFKFLQDNNDENMFTNILAAINKKTKQIKQEKPVKDNTPVVHSTRSNPALSALLTAAAVIESSGVLPINTSLEKVQPTSVCIDAGICSGGGVSNSQTSSEISTQ